MRILLAMARAALAPVCVSLLLVGSAGLGVSDSELPVEERESCETEAVPTAIRRFSLNVASHTDTADRHDHELKTALRTVTLHLPVAGHRLPNGLTAPLLT